MRKRYSVNERVRVVANLLWNSRRVSHCFNQWKRSSNTQERNANGDAIIAQKCLSRKICILFWSEMPVYSSWGYGTVFFVLQTRVSSPTHIHPNQAGASGVTLQGNYTFIFSWSAWIMIFWCGISRPRMMTLLRLVAQSFQSHDLRGKNHAMFKEDNTVSSLNILSSARWDCVTRLNERLCRK